MADLRETSQAADEYNYSDQDQDWSAVYAAGTPGFGTQGPVNITAGQGSGGYEPEPSREIQMNLGPLYHYENGQKVYAEGDYAPGQIYSPKTPASTYTPEGGRIGINWGSQEKVTPPTGSNVAANFGWATPYNQAPGSPAKTGLKTSGVSGGGITTSQKPYATIQTSKTVYPTGTQFPTFKGPTWDEKEIRKRTQKGAAPGLRALEMKVTQAMARYYENPNVRRMVLRDTLAGYGIGIANIRAQAERTAQADYSQEYGRMYTEAMNDFNRQMAKMNTQATQVHTTQQVPTQAAYEKIAGTQEKLSTLQ